MEQDVVVVENTDGSVETVTTSTYDDGSSLTSTQVANQDGSYDVEVCACSYTTIDAATGEVISEYTDDEVATLATDSDESDGDVTVTEYSNEVEVDTFEFSD